MSPGGQVPPGLRPSWGCGKAWEDPWTVHLEVLGVLGALVFSRGSSPLPLGQVRDSGLSFGGVKAMAPIGTSLQGARNTAFPQGSSWGSSSAVPPVGTCSLRRSGRSLLTNRQRQVQQYSRKPGSDWPRQLVPIPRPGLTSTHTPVLSGVPSGPCQQTQRRERNRGPSR